MTFWLILCSLLQVGVGCSSLSASQGAEMPGQVPLGLIYGCKELTKGKDLEYADQSLSKRAHRVRQPWGRDGGGGAVGEKKGRTSGTSVEQRGGGLGDTMCKVHEGLAGGIHLQGAGCGSHMALLPGSPVSTPAPPSSDVDLIPIWMFTMIFTSLSDLCLLHLPSWGLTLKPTIPVWESSWYPHPSSHLGSTSLD